MGGFLDVLGQIGQGIGQNIVDKETSRLQKSPIGGALYNMYQSRRMNPQSAQDAARNAGNVSMEDTVNGMNRPPAAPPPPVPIPPGAGSPSMGAGPAPNTTTMPSPDAIGAASGLESLAGGRIVTSPMIARIGEKGPEAVVPLTPRAGNKMQPDILEGHMTPPKVPGVRYSRYQGYNRFGPNAGGAL